MRARATDLLVRLGLYRPARTLYRALKGVRYPGDVAMRFPPHGSTVERRVRRAPDYVRYSAMALALRRIEREGVPGALAEVGVYQGKTARFMRELAPERELYLFDTFEGFPGAAADGRFVDTSVELLRQVIGDMRRVVVRKGVFPETAAGLEEQRFAFVSVDVDLYEPTRDALAFFFPRVSPGGYLFVHDYNSPESGYGSQRAVDESGLGFVELPDLFGSVVIRRDGRADPAS